MPKVKIFAHVASFSTICIGGTVLALGISKVFGQSEEEKLAMLRSKYPTQNSPKQAAQREEMQKFFNQLKNQSGKREAGDLDTKFNDILKGGKKEIRRHSTNSDAVKEHAAECTKKGDKGHK